LPQRSSEEDTDRDESLTIGDEISEAESSNGNNSSSFLQLQTDGNITTNEANLGESMVTKDFSNTDVEAQAKARLMSYLARYSDERSRNQDREDGEDKSTIDGASRVSHDGSAASFVSQEASLLKNLGVVADEVGGEEKAKDKVTSSCASIDVESNNCAGSNASGASKSADIDLDLRSTESNLLGVATVPDQCDNKSAQSNPRPTNDDLGDTGCEESEEGNSNKDGEDAEEICEVEDQETKTANGSSIEPQSEVSILCERDNGAEGKVERR